MTHEVSCELWTINRVIRWIGVRLTVNVWDGTGERTRTRLGLAWYGLPGSDGWRSIEPHNPTPIRTAVGRWLG
jgi:hypothetical protein